MKTYRHTLKFEVAAELLNGRLSVLCEQLDIEESKEAPDMASIRELETLIDENSDQRMLLDVTNEAGLDAVISALANSPDDWSSPVR